MKLKLRWKKEPKETGLRAIGARPRSYILHDGDKKYASVSPDGGGWSHPLRGWYWVAGWDSDVPYANTCDAPCVTSDGAKQQAMEYVKNCLLNKPTM